MLYKGQPAQLHNALLEDAFIMVEHGKMSLAEALKMGLSFIRMCQQSPSFETVVKRLESERMFKTSLLERLDSIISVSQSRR